MLTTLLSFIFVLGVLIFVHELGHFLVAKRVGIKVERFSLGFPPYIFSKKYGETAYSIGIIPLGGFVKMAGENPDEEVTGDPREFMSKSIGQRAAVIFAGPFMNYVLAILISIGMVYFSGRYVTDDTKVIIGSTTEGYPADLAGMKADDVILAVNGNPVSKFGELQKEINAVVEGPIEVTWVSGNDTTTKTLTTAADARPQLDGSYDTVGVIGFSQRIERIEGFGFVESVTQGTAYAHMLVIKTAEFVVKVFSGQVSPKMLGGPLFIARQSGIEAEKGAVSLFNFMALLSVNLAILNVLPIPVLDGGHLVFLAIEKIKGSPLSMKARMISQQVGVVALLTLIVFVTYNDIIRVIKGF